MYMFWHLEWICDQKASYVHYFLYSTPTFSKIFGILLSFEFSIKDTWLVLYATDSKLSVLFTSATECPVSIIVFDICSVEKTYPFTKNSLQMIVFLQ